MSVPPPIPAPAKLPSVPLQPRSFSSREWVLRLVVATTLCVASALAWWTFKVRLLPLQKQSRELTITVSHLSTEVDALESQWPPVKQEEVASRLALAHGLLFSNQTTLEVWLSHVKEQANPLLLETRTALGQSVSKLKGEEEIAVIPTTISVDVRPVLHHSAKDSPYERVLQLTQQLAGPAKRADLAELTVVGGTNSISSAALVFDLWAGVGGKP